jgi:lipopolysaccharide transport protein LptA
MAGSFHSRARGRAAGLVALCALATLPFAAVGQTRQIGSRDLPINLEAASSDFDYKNNALLFRRVRITQGELQVEAQEARATGLNFENSEWLLSGSVRIVVPDGRLDSNQANVTFKDNDIVLAVIRGKPARFEQRLEDSGQLAKGEAGTIEYDVRGGTVRLSGGAWLSDGSNEIRGDTLVYNIGAQRVVANPDEKDPGGVRITINPAQPGDAKEPGREPAPGKDKKQ